MPRRDGSRRAAGEPLTTADVCAELVKPATAARQCAYVEVAAHTVPATVYVSHAWKYLFHQVVDALEQAADERDGVWFCALNNNQWATGAHSYAFFEREFRANLAAIGRTVLVFAPWSAPTTLTRATAILATRTRSSPCTTWRGCSRRRASWPRRSCSSAARLRAASSSSARSI